MSSIAALRTAALVVGVLVWGCDDGEPASPDVAIPDMTQPDVLAPDMGETDAALPDLAVDRGPVDAAPVDALPLDMAPDADLDAGPDAEPDAVPDAEPDAIPDIERFDIGPAFRDAAPVDPVEPCTLFPCVCEPGAVEPCYDGPPDTIGVGICAEGQRTCAEDGQGFGPCEQQQPPLGEDCRTPDVDEDCDGETPACADVWLRTYAADGQQAVRAVAVAPNGDVIVAADFYQTVNFGAGPVTARAEKADLALVRYDRQGNVLWSRTFGDADHQFATRILAGPQGEVLLLARTYGSVPIDDGFVDSTGGDDGLLLLLEPDGAVRWAKTLGGGGRDVFEAAVFVGDRILVAGNFEEQARFGQRLLDSAGGRDAVALVIDAADGEVLVARHAGGVEDDTGMGIVPVPDGGMIIGGRFEQIFSWGGPPVESAGAGDIYLTGLDADGAFRWTRRFGGPGDEHLYSMLFDPTTETVLLFGWFEAGATFDDLTPDNAGARDFFVARVGVDGAVQAVVPFGDAADQPESPFPTTSRASMALGPDGQIYLAGPFSGSAFGDPPLQAVGGVDGFAVRLDPALNVVGQLGFGTEFSEMALDVALDHETGHMVLGGRFYSRNGLTIGPFADIDGEESSDGFVVRLPSL